MSLLILPARTPDNSVAQRLDHYDGLTSSALAPTFLGMRADAWATTGPLSTHELM
jgi:hypothetical protein